MLIDRHWLGPTEDETAKYRQQRRHQYGADRVDVSQRIETEPAQVFGGGIAATQRHPAVRHLVQGDRQQQRWRQHDEELNHIQFLHGVIIRSPSGRGLEKWAGVAQSLANQLWGVFGQIEHGGRFLLAGTTVNDQIHVIAQAFFDFLRIG